MSAVCRMAVVAGSGLDLRNILDEVCWEKPFAVFPGLSPAGVAGHAGTFTEGLCGAVRVIVQQGRRHFYEGLKFEEVTATVRVLASFGVDRIVFTNAAGGLKAGLEPGALMAAECIMTWPYRGWPDAPGETVPNWRVPECEASGTYAWVHGPSYETRAEIAALQRQGAWAVGMSTAPEIVAAQGLGMRAGAISCITNTCCRRQRLTHDEVLDIGQHHSARLCELLRRVLPGFAEGDQKTDRLF
ncbi:MAG TPA: purine-nucleoside phosphorylase [Candidatus Hydrogenedentes bacterium]|nr:purine-nucleoside phosphorylase [Candidatus Hydrogenedentota bacterium]